MKAPRIVKLRGRGDIRHGRTHEVMAPDGYRLRYNGIHSSICYGSDEAQQVAAEGIEPCDCWDCEGSLAR